MHVQSKSPVNPAAFSDEVEDDIGSVDYPRFALADLLDVLARNEGPGDPPFDLGGTSGHNLELGGEIAFWARAREGVDVDQNNEPDHELATIRATERLQGAGYDAKAFHVQAKHVEDTPGALAEFVREVSGRGHHILEITVGAPEPDGIPVQIFTTRLA